MRCEIELTREGWRVWGYSGNTRLGGRQVAITITRWGARRQARRWLRERANPTKVEVIRP